MTRPSDLHECASCTRSPDNSGEECAPVAQESGLVWTPQLGSFIHPRIRAARQEARSHGYLGTVGLPQDHPLAGLRERLVVHRDLRNSILEWRRSVAPAAAEPFVSILPMRLFGVEVEEHAADPERFPVMLFTYDLAGLPRQTVILGSLNTLNTLNRSNT